MKKKRELILLVGNIGTGKTTYAKKYQKRGYVVIARDGLRYTIGGGNYIFNTFYEPVIWRTELDMFKRFASLGVNIIVDEVGLSKKIRERYICYALPCGYKITIIVMPKISMVESVVNRMKNPHHQPDPNLWEEVWNKFDKMYEEPSKKEGIDKIIKLRKI